MATSDTTGRTGTSGDGFDATFTTVTPRTAAVITIQATMDGLGAEISRAFGELGEAMEARSTQPEAEPFVHYLSRVGADIVAEAGFPVAGPVEPSGRVRSGSLPGGEVATTVHVGPYDTLRETYGRLESWIREHGRSPAGEVWEIYLTEPAGDPSTWRTRICWPLD